MMMPGNIIVSASVEDAVGAHLSRHWEAGASIADLLTLGDVTAGFGIDTLSMADIARLSGGWQLSLSSIPQLAALPLYGVVEMLPQLSDLAVRDVPVIADVLLLHGIDSSLFSSVGQVLQNPQLAQIPLGALDLTVYDVAALPGIQGVPLNHLPGWQNLPLSHVRGLIDIPFTRMPGGALFTARGAAIADVMLSDVEQVAAHTVSGGDQVGFRVPCQGRCAHIELGPPYQGLAWVSGLSQQVRGGFGFLSTLNGGLEPTGRHPFGPAFKVVVGAIDEATGTAQTALYFRVCVKTWFVHSCSPYFIGPVPWIPIREGDWLILG